MSPANHLPHGVKASQIYNNSECAQIKQFFIQLNSGAAEMFSYGVLHSLNRVLPAPNPAELNSQIQGGLHAGFISANTFKAQVLFQTEVCFKAHRTMKMFGNNFAARRNKNKEIRLLPWIFIPY